MISTIFHILLSFALQCHLYVKKNKFKISNFRNFPDIGCTCITTLYKSIFLIVSIKEPIHHTICWQCMLRKNRDKETTKIRAKVLAFPLTCMKVFINDICCTCIDLDLRWTCGGLFISYDTWGSERDVGSIGFKICASHLLYN